MSALGGTLYTKEQLSVVQGGVGNLSKHWGWLLALKTAQ